MTLRLGDTAPDFTTDTTHVQTKPITLRDVKENLNALDPNAKPGEKDSKRADDQVVQKNKPKPGPAGKG